MRKYYLPVALLVTGFVLAYFWFSLKHPKQVMYVEILNDTQTTFPSVIIEHGGNGIQEKITLTQFKPQEVRTVALNHSPGMVLISQLIIPMVKKPRFVGARVKITGLFVRL